MLIIWNKAALHPMSQSPVKGRGVQKSRITTVSHAKNALDHLGRTYVQNKLSNKKSIH